MGITLFLPNLSYIIPACNLTYQWDFDDSKFDNLKDPVHDYVKDGIYQIKLIATSDLGCSDSIIKSMTVFPSPDIAFTINDSSQCFHENHFVFKNSLQSIVNKRQWAFGDGAVDSQAFANHKYLNTGLFVVKLIVYTDNNCIDSISKIVSVLPSPTADFMVNDSSQCLKNNLFNFTNKSDGLSHTFKWSFGDGVNDSSYSPTYSFNKPRKFDITLKAFTTDFCIDSLIKRVEVRPNPSTPIVGSNSPVCKNNVINLNAISTPNSSYFWTNSNGFTSGLQNPIITNASLNDSGLYYVKAILNGCVSDVRFTRVIVNPLPVVNLGNDRAICEGYLVVTLDPGYFNSYLWQDSTINREYNVYKPGVYSVVVTDSFGCKNRDEIIFLEKCPAMVYIPNAFSPNDDGINDKFVIVTNNLMYFEIRIFDRWGENIFHSSDPNISWDGTYKGKYCPLGTFTYIIYTRDNDAVIRNYQGIVTLIK